MKKGFKWLLGIALVLTLMLSPVAGLLGFSGMALAATTANVTINATPGWLSISNNLTTFDFETVYEDVDKNTTADGGFNVTNVGSITANVTIQCNGWTNLTGTNIWTYGAAGDNQSQLKASIDGGAFDITVQNGTAVALNASLAKDLSQLWGLEIDVPSTIGHGDQQQTTITLTATLP